MTLRMYADRKKYAYDSFEVAVTHNKIHAKDCEDCETADGKVDEFQRIISMHGDFTGEQRQRMLEIADRCPVHRTLHSEVKVRTKLAGDG